MKARGIMTTAGSEWRRWLAGGVAPRWYLAIIPLAAIGFLVGDLEGFLESPLWVPVTFLVAAVAIRMLAFTRWGRDCTQRQLHYRSALQAALVTAVIFATGWGPMLALGYLIVAQEGIWASGSRAVVPGLIWSLVALGIGEFLLAVGIAPSAVDAAAAHTIAGLAAAGTIFGVYLMQVTAEEREEAASAEHRAREYLSTVLSQVPDAIVVVNRDGTIRYVSDAATQLFGRTPERLVGVEGIDLVDADDRAAVREMFAGILARPDTTATIECRVEDANGTTRWVQFTARNLLHVPEIDGVLGTVRDTTERKQIERERVALDRARELFLATAAHELRTPLTTLVGAVGLVDRHGPESEEGQEALHLIRRQGRRVADLVDQLLDLSALDAGVDAVQLEAVEVAPLVHDLTSGMPTPPHVSLETRVPEDLVVTADPVRVEQILTNLLTNAYAYGGPHVRVDAEADAELVRISVSDDGPGIPDDLATSIFEPFARGPGDGTGLGLAISRRLARALGGTLTHREGPQHGTQFILTLPACQLGASGSSIEMDAAS